MSCPSADDSLGTVGDLEFGEDVGDVVVYGLQAEEELFGDLLVIVPASDEVQDLARKVVSSGKMVRDVLAGSDCGRALKYSAQASRGAWAEYGISSRTMHHLV